MKILEKLRSLSDEKNAEFQKKLTPGADPGSFLGTRVPDLRKLAKDYIKDPECEEFLNTLPHTYFDEYMLHAILVSLIKGYDETVSRVDELLPYVDNWAVCDTIIPKSFKKNPEGLLKEVDRWVSSTQTYTIRFGIKVMMSFFLDDLFRPEYLEIPANIVSEEYYVNMMRAWYYATALAKQYEATIPYIEGKRLDKWTHNKSIQKARESFRITDEQKEYLNSLKIK